MPGSPAWACTVQLLAAGAALALAAAFSTDSLLAFAYLAPSRS